MYLLTVATALLIAAGATTDASRQWTYELTADGAAITGYADKKPTGDLVIPGEVDGHTPTRPA